MGTVANVKVGSASAFYIGTAETVPTSGDPGYSLEGLRLLYGLTLEDAVVDEEIVPVDVTLMDENLRVVVDLAEPTLANMAKAIIGADGGTSYQLKVGGTTISYFSLLIATACPGATGVTRRIFIPRITAIGAVEMRYAKGHMNSIPAEFKAVKPETVGSVIGYIYDSWAVTLDTDAFTYVAAESSYLVDGESAAADALATITLGDGEDGSKCTIRIADASHAITVNELGNIDLDTDETLLLNNLWDYLELTYSTGTSKWVESARFIAV